MERDGSTQHSHRRGGMICKLLSDKFSNILTFLVFLFISFSGQSDNISEAIPLQCKARCARCQGRGDDAPIHIRGANRSESHRFSHRRDAIATEHLMAPLHRTSPAHVYKWHCSIHPAKLCTTALGQTHGMASGHRSNCC